MRISFAPITLLLTSIAAAQGSIAETGFNDAAGIHSDSTPNSPYALGTGAPSQPIPGSEAGWSTSWFLTFGTAATIEAGGALEGDGSLLLAPSTQLDREFTPQTGIFEVELAFKATPKTSFTGYVTNGTGGPADDATVWSLHPDGRVTVLDGVGDNCGTGACQAEDTGMTYTPGTWHVVRVLLDVPNQTYRFFFDGVEYLGPDPLGFRGNALALLDGLSLLVVGGGGIHIDSIRITAPAAVPALTTRALLLFAILLGGVGVLAVRSSRSRSRSPDSAAC